MVLICCAHYLLGNYPIARRMDHSLPVMYKHNRNAWMTGEIWEEWLQSFNQKMVQQKQKVLLLADNCPSHPIVPRLQAMTVHFLPPNTTAVLQPID